MADDKGFEVRDRRRFTSSGEMRDDAAPDAQESQPQEPPPPQRQQDDAAERVAEEMPSATGFTLGESPTPRDPEITFSSFLVGLSTQALFCLGEISEAEGEPSIPEDLPAARELIDILGMLQDKTRGNLEPEEARLIENILFDLRMRYVRKVRK